MKRLWGSVCLVAVIYTTTFGLSDTHATLKDIRVLSDGQTHYGPPKIIFDFSKRVTVKQSVDEQERTMSFDFSGIGVRSFNAPLVLKTLKGLAPLVSAATIKQIDDATVRLQLAFDAPEADETSARVTVAINQSEHNHRTPRIVLSFYSHKLIKMIQSKSQRQIHLARGPDPRGPTRLLAQRRIILDAGHGGPDAGAQGLFSLVEKEITLDIAQRVKAHLEQQGARVLLTRSADKQLSLSKRVQIARHLKGDIFVSIHANSAGRNREPHGIETFHLDSGVLDKQVMCSLGEGDDAVLATLRDELARNIALSSQLSYSIQQSVLGSLRSAGFEPRDRGVKQEMFCLLLGGQIPRSMQPLACLPTSLVEVGFITNVREAARLKTSAYRDVIARGIGRGIKQFITQQG